MKIKLIYIQIFTALFIGFIASRILIKNVFIANTPRIQSDFVSSAKNLFALLLSGGRYSISKLSDAESQQMDAMAKSNLLRPLTKGIYAAEDAKRTYMIVKENEVEWMEYSYVVKGKTVKIRVPRGATAPTQDTVEKLY